MPDRLGGVEWLLETSRLLQLCPGIEKQWLIGSDIDEIISETERYLRLSQSYEDNRNIIVSLYTPDFLSLPGDLCDRSKRSLDELFRCIGRSLADDVTFVSNRNLLVAWAQDFSGRLENWGKDLVFFDQRTHAGDLECATALYSSHLLNDPRSDASGLADLQLIIAA